MDEYAYIPSDGNDDTNVEEDSDYITCISFFIFSLIVSFVVFIIMRSY
jgi:hypothetical protein